MTYAAVIDTPVGRLAVTATRAGVREILYTDLPVSAGDETSAAAAAQLAEFFAGERKAFDLDIDWELVTTPFARQVLAHVHAIPAGQTRTYAQVAAAIGRPGATRAVGSALRRNPIVIVVPCHRVVRADGIGRYAGAADGRKALLLAADRA